MEQLRIDLVPMGVTPNAHASQYDVGRVIRFLLYNGGTVYTLAGTETITVKMAKPDGTEETVSVTNTSSNYVDFVTTDGLLNQAGLYPCEISITSGTDVIGSKNFNLRVELDPYDGADVVTLTVGPADICTFTTTLAEPLQSVTVNVLATGGNGTHDSPISINGYTEANITRFGVNLWDEVWELGTINDSTGEDTPMSDRIRSKNYIPVKNGQTYYFTSAYLHKVIYYDINKNFVSGGDTAWDTKQTYVLPNNVYYIRFAMAGAYGTIYNNDISINYPATDTNYHPYTGNTYTIAFGQTVYGGVLDVTRGKLHVTHNKRTFNGSETWYYSSTYNRVYTNIADTKINSAFISNVLTNSQTVADYNGYINDQKNLIIYAPASITSSSDWQTWLGSNSLEICYELATPFDIDLTPEVISAVVGTNNVFADCGETEVKYLKAEG